MEGGGIMFGLYDANVVLTGTTETKTDVYYCELCGDEKTRTTVVSSSDWQAHGVSCQYVVIEQSDTTDFSSIKRVKAIKHGSTKVNIKHKYVRAFIMGGTKTMVFIGDSI
jgi:hypothetical protein